MRQPEVWKAVPGFPGYEISDMGRMRRQVPALLCIKGRGARYRKVSLRDPSGKKKNFWLHRLMLLTFVGPAPDGCEACHNDGNRRNNRLSNLRWDTRRANMLDKMKHGTHLAGEDHPGTRVSRRQALRIRALLNEGKDTVTVANRFWVPLSTVELIKSGKHWSVKEEGGTVQRSRSPFSGDGQIASACKADTSQPRASTA